ncbi:hypothetical protein DVQ45_14780 [Yersinia enterocolitica]|nr:hypothetical protein [Yersinia enterocolitica]
MSRHCKHHDVLIKREQVILAKAPSQDGLYIQLVVIEIGDRCGTEAGIITLQSTSGFSGQDLADIRHLR